MGEKVIPAGREVRQRDVGARAVAENAPAAPLPKPTHPEFVATGAGVGGGATGGRPEGPNPLGWRGGLGGLGHVVMIGEEVQGEEVQGMGGICS